MGHSTGHKSSLPLPRHTILHVTSSPLYPQSNGQVERTVQTIKKILRQADDTCQGLLSYQTTPMPWCNFSPSELVMGRRLRSLLPMTDNLLIPQWPYLSEFQKSNEQFKAKQKKDFDQRHHTKNILHCQMIVKYGSPPAESQ